MTSCRDWSWLHNQENRLWVRARLETVQSEANAVYLRARRPHPGLMWKLEPIHLTFEGAAEVGLNVHRGSWVYDGG